MNEVAFVLSRAQVGALLDDLGEANGFDPFEWEPGEGQPSSLSLDGFSAFLELRGAYDALARVA